MGRGERGAATADLLRTTLAERGRTATLTVSSTSMEPSLRAGDRITIEEAGASTLRHGDVIVFESPSAGLVVHRLMWRAPLRGTPRELVTKGDALPHCDKPFPPSSLLGRVVAVEREGSRRALDRRSGYMAWIRGALTMGWQRGFGSMGRKILSRLKAR